MCESVLIFTHPEKFGCAKIETFQILYKYIPIQVYYISCIQGGQKFLQVGVCTIESKWFITCSTERSFSSDSLVWPAPPSSHPMCELCCRPHFYITLQLPNQGEQSTVSHGVIYAFRFQWMASLSLRLEDLLQSITLVQPVSKEKLFSHLLIIRQYLLYKYISLKNSDNRKTCDKSRTLRTSG